MSTADTARDSTTCGGSSAIDASATSASPAARSSARHTRTCSPAAYARWSSTASSTPSTTPRARRRTTSTSSGTQTRAFGGFLSLCESAGPARCALAGHGPVTPRFEGLLAELPARIRFRRPTASPPGELTYGDSPSRQIVSQHERVARKLAGILAAALEGARRGDGSQLLGAASRAADDGVLRQETSAPGLPAVGLTCADSPARQSPSCVAVLVEKAQRGQLRPTGRCSVGGGGRPAQSSPVRSADRYTRSLERHDEAIRSW